MKALGATPAAVSSAAVPRIVQPDHPQTSISSNPREGPVDIPGLQRSTVPSGEDVSALRPSDAPGPIHSPGAALPVASIPIQQGHPSREGVCP